MYFPRTFAEKMPDHPAIIMAESGEIITYLQLEEEANKLAHYFRDIGLVSGDHISLYLENDPYYLIASWAAIRAGLVYTCISVHLSVSDVEYILNNSESLGVITSKLQSEKIAQIVDNIPDVKHRLMLNGTIDGFDSLEEKVKNRPITPITDEIEGTQMLYSSGTTGRPKGILRERLEAKQIGELEPLVQVLLRAYEFNKDTPYLSPAPLYHSAPHIYCLTNHRVGGTVIVMEKFDAEHFLSLVEKYKVVNTQLVPTMFVRMLKLPREVREKYDLSTLKAAIHAAAPCPIPVKEQMIDWWGPIIYEYYAGTEGNCFVTIASEDWLTHKGSVGKAMLGVPHIMDENGDELPAGEIGEAYFSDSPAFEYYKDPEKTNKSRNKHGWGTLSDVGYLDEEGYLYLTDRTTNMIISGGVNIYPQETENVLVMHPKIKDVAVIGVPNEDFGEEVRAVVELLNADDAGAPLEKELIDMCIEKLGKIKSPRKVDFVDDLPRYPTGKLFKRLLKDRYWKGQTLTGAAK